MRARRWTNWTLAVALVAVGLASIPVSSTAAGAVGAPARFVPLTPTRLLDTRDGTGQAGAGAVGSGATIRLQVAGRGGVPADDVVAVVMNVTATDASGPGFVTVWPSTESRPTASNVNVERAGQTISNLVTVQLGTDGAVNLFAIAATDLVADVSGYFTPSGPTGPGRLQPVAPARVLDTRAGVGAPVAAVTGGSTLSLDLSASAPAGTEAAVLNVTATNTTAPGFVTAWPSGLPLPLASNLNIERAGQTIANLVIVPVGADGHVNLYSQSTLDLVADAEGYVTGSAAPMSGDGLFTSLVPTRALDTRTATPLPHLGAGRAASLPLAGPAGLPATGVAAVLMNVAATNADAPGFVTVFPDTGALPLASNLNVSAPGQTIANLALGQLGTTGNIGLYSQSGADLVADIAGWFSGPPVVAAPPGPGPALPVNPSLANSFRAVYALPSDVVADPTIVPGIRHEMDLVTGWFASQTGGHRPRLYAPDGVLAVDTVNLGITTAQLEAGAPLDILAATLHGLGYGTSGETVVAFVPAVGDACGSTLTLHGAPTTVGIWMPSCDIYPSVDTESWPYGATYLTAHEMTHAFGAVPACAPHADGTGHVNDDTRDVVYAGPDPRDWDHITLDPGHDDYYAHGRSDCPDIAASPFWT